MSGLPLGDEKEVKAFSIRLGRALRKRKGTPYGRSNVRLDMKEDKHSKQKLWSVTDKPVTLAKPARLDWNRQNTTFPEGKVEARSAEENQMLAQAATIRPEECQVPHCDRKREGDNGFAFDRYGHVWCHWHTNRKHILERGGNLQTPFPSLFYARGSQMLEEGQPSWEEFVLTAPDEAIDEILKRIENCQARENLLKRQVVDDTT